jgi:hypothetical protein
MAINRPTAEDRSSESTGFTPVAFPIAITLLCKVMPMQMVTLIRTILKDQQWKRIAPELPRRDGQKLRPDPGRADYSGLIPANFTTFVQACSAAGPLRVAD